MLAVLAFVAASSMNAGPEMRDIGLRMPLGEAASVTIAAMPFTRTVTCSTYTLTGSASGGSGAVSWSASPSGASGACTGTTSWSCVVDVDPDAVGEGVETITVARSGATSDTETIGFYVDGEHSCFLAQSVNGTYNTGLSNADAVATWTNLGSSAKNVTQGTGSAQPSYRTAVVGGQPVVRCDGTDRIAGTTASDWSFLSNGTDLTVEYAFSPTEVNSGIRQTVLTTQSDLISFTNVGGSWFYDDVAASFNDTTRALIANGTSYNLVTNGTNGTVAGATYNLIQVVNDDDGGAGVDQRQYANGAASGTGTKGAGAYPAGPPAGAVTLCGETDGGLYLTGDLFRVHVYQSALTATQLGINEAVDEWAMNGTLPITVASETWLFVGDSLTAGTGLVTPYSVKLAQNQPNVFFVNAAVAGNTASQILAQWTANKTPAPAKVFVLGGVNDINAGTSAATTFTSLAQIYSEAAALGTQVIAMPTLPFGNGSGWTAADQTQLLLLEASIVADTNVDVLVNFYDLMGEPGTPEDLAAIYDSGDGVHPNEAGTTFMADEVATALGL